MKKIVTIVFAWVASLGLIGLSLFLGMEYTKLSAQASQDLKSDLQALGDFDLDRALSETTLTLNPAESELIMNAFLDRNPQVLELRLSIPRAMALDTRSEGSDINTPQSEENNDYLVNISLLGGESDTQRTQAKQDIDPLGVFYRSSEVSFVKEGKTYFLSAYAPVISEEEYLLFLRISGITLIGLGLVILILLMIPNSADTDPQFRKVETQEAHPRKRTPGNETPSSDDPSHFTSSVHSRLETAEEKPSSKWKASESQDKLYASSGLSHSWFMIPRMDNELSRAGSFSLDLSVVVFDSSELRERDIRLKVAREVIDFFTYKDMCFEGMGNRIWVMIPSQRLEIALRTVEEFLAQLSAASLPSLYAGVASRSGRLMSGERLAEEAEKALEKATGSMDRVVGFKADPDRYRNFLAGKEK
jgi:hypothetical protein